VNPSRLLILMLAPVVFLGAGCQATLPSSPDEPSTKALGGEPRYAVKDSVATPMIQSITISSPNKIAENPKSVAEAIDKIKIVYKQVKKLLGDGDLEGVSQGALRLNRYAQSVVDLMQNASPEELAHVQLLAQNLGDHALEVAEFAQQGDAKSAQFHLKHVVQQAINALRSKVLKRAISNEKALMKQE